MKRYFITPRQREQAERMAEKWAARSLAYYASNDPIGYCQTAEAARLAMSSSERITEAVAKLMTGRGEWADVEVILAAVAGRDALDAGMAVTHDA